MIDQHKVDVLVAEAAVSAEQVDSVETKVKHKIPGVYSCNDS